MENFNKVQDQTLDKEEKEIIESAQEKILNIFNTKDLKYKAPFGGGVPNFILMTQNGLVSSEVLASTAKEIGKKWKDIKDEPREQLVNNVYYPQRSLVMFKKFLEDGYTKNDFIEDHDPTTKKENVFFGEINSTLLIIRDGILNHQIDIDDDFAREVIKCIEDIARFSNLNGKWKDGVNLSDSSNISPEHTTILKRLFEEFGDQLETMWNKKFFLEAEEARKPNKLFGSQGRGDQETNLIGYYYTSDILYMLSPDIPVVSSSHMGFGSDYPTEAVLNTMRVAPRKFIGIVINRKIYEKRQSMFFKFTAEDSNVPDNNDNIEFLKSTPFIMPNNQQELFFLMHEVAKFTPTLLSEYLLNKCGLSNSEVEKQLGFLSEYSAWPSYANTYSSTDIENIYVNCTSFIKEFSPIHQGDKLWDVVLWAAKELKVPIYDTSGDVLWPTAVEGTE